MLRETWTGPELQSGGCAVAGEVRLGDCGVHLPKPVLGKGLKGHLCTWVEQEREGL